MKPMNRDNILTKIPKRFVRYEEGAELYSISQGKFIQMAKAAGACYKIDKVVLVNCDIFEQYLETFKLDPEDERW